MMKLTLVVFAAVLLLSPMNISAITLRGASRGQLASNDQNAMGLSAKAKASLDEVVQLLMQMLKEFDTMMSEDNKNWEDYSTWSDTSEVDKQDFLAKTQAYMMQQSALQSSNENEVQVLTGDLSQLAKDTAETKVSITELINLRSAEHQQHEAELMDITKTLAAVQKAIQILEGFYTEKDKAVLTEITQRLEVALTMRSKASSASINQLTTALLQQSTKQPDYLNVDGGKYDAYEKQEGGYQAIDDLKGIGKDLQAKQGNVVDSMLADLRMQLEQQRQESIEKEGESQRQFEETKGAKETDLAHMGKLTEEKSLRKTEDEATIEQCMANIKQAVIDIANAKVYLENLIKERTQFQKEFDERVAMRRNEQAATQAALDALQTVASGSGQRVGFIETDQAGTSLIQTGTVSRRSTQKLKKVVNKLIKMGQNMRSSSLIQAATALGTHVPTEGFDNFMGDKQASFYDASGFGPVIKLLRDLITRLEEEAAAETSQHEWCENEKTSGVATQQEREKTINSLTAEVDSETTSVATLKSEVEFLESELVRIQQETQAAIALRAEQKSAYDQAKADHEEVIHAINVALEALGGQYALVQLKVRHRSMLKARQPSTEKGNPFGAYQSGGAGGASAMEMLQDLLGRYSTALEEIIATEIAQKKAHEDLLAKNEQFRIDTTNTKNAKTAERRAKINRLNDAKEELKTSMIELHEVSKYLQDLRPSCDDIRSTFEERKKRREAEISALKEALEVISDPSMR